MSGVSEWCEWCQCVGECCRECLPRRGVVRGVSERCEWCECVGLCYRVCLRIRYEVIVLTYLYDSRARLICSMIECLSPVFVVTLFILHDVIIHDELDRGGL